MTPRLVCVSLKLIGIVTLSLTFAGNIGAESAKTCSGNNNCSEKSGK